MDLTLQEIAENIQCETTATLATGLLTGVNTDSRQAKAGELFVALRGDNFDGHNFVFAALEKGAAACLVDKTWFDQNAGTMSGRPAIVVPDTLTAFQEIARYYRQKLNPTVAALTGSAGKTTCKEYLHAVLSQKYNVHKNSKSFNNHVGVPATLLSLSPEHQMLVAELGTSNFGEITTLSRLVEPQVCILLNIGYAHLEFLKSLDGVAQAKMEIFAHARPDNVAIYNADDETLAKQKFPAAKVISFGINAGNVRAESLACDDNGCYTFRVVGVPVRLAVPGRHNIYNALAAITVGLYFKVPIELCKKAIESVTFVEHRMTVMQINNNLVLDDVYNANPGSCRAALETLADFRVKEGGRRIAVLGDMLELGEFARLEHEKLASVAAQNAVAALFLYGPEMAAMAAKAADLNFTLVRHFDDQAALVQELRGFITKNDVVLIKGSRSMHMENVVNALKDEPVKA